MKTSKIDSKGFALTDVLVASGLMLTLALAAASMTKNNSSAIRAAEIRSNMNLFSSTVIAPNLANAHCGGLATDYALHPRPSMTVGNTIPLLNTMGDVITPGVGDGFHIESIKVDSVNAAAGGYEATVGIAVTLKPNETQLGSPNVAKTQVFYVTGIINQANQNRFLECYGSGNNANLSGEEISKRICMAKWIDPCMSAEVALARCTLYFPLTEFDHNYCMIHMSSGIGNWSDVRLDYVDSETHTEAVTGERKCQSYTGGLPQPGSQQCHDIIAGGGGNGGGNGNGGGHGNPPINVLQPTLVLNAGHR